MLILIFHQLFSQLHQQEMRSPIFEPFEYEFVNSSSHVESGNFQGWLHEYVYNFLFFLSFSLPPSLSPSLLSFLPLFFLVFLYIYIYNLRKIYIYILTVTLGMRPGRCNLHVNNSNSGLKFQILCSNYLHNIPEIQLNVLY